MPKSKGFSLIELMVVIAIIGILAGVAAPSFLSQMNKNKINTVEKDLRLVIGRARGIALRNQFGFFGADVDGKSNAVVCFNSATLTLSLHEGASTVGANCGERLIWSAQVNENITIHNVTAGAETDFQQISFDNKGKIITAGCPSGKNCSAGNTFNIRLSNSVATSGNKVIY